MTTSLDMPRFSGPALCAQTDPDEFYPDKGGSSRAAKQVCTNCEIRDECLQYALDNDERYGIWGGLSERERRRLRPARRPGPPADGPINHGSESGYKAHRRRNEDACGACLEASAAAKRYRDAERQRRHRTTAPEPTPSTDPITEPLAEPTAITTAPATTAHRTWTDAELHDAVQLLRGHGMTYGEMADQLGASLTRVRAAVRQGAAA